MKTFSIRIGFRRGGLVVVVIVITVGMIVVGNIRRSSFRIVVSPNFESPRVHPERRGVKNRRPRLDIVRTGGLHGVGRVKRPTVVRQLAGEF